MITDRSQRWRDRREFYVPAASEIRPEEYSVDVIDCQKVAKPFVTSHHYSHSLPATRLSAGLYRNGPAGASRLVGVCCFSVPVNNSSIPKHTGLLDPNQGADLGRLVLLDEEPGNAESFFVSRALRLLRREKPGIISIVSYSDPMERRAPDGTLKKFGHVGQIYQQTGFLHRGLTKPRPEYLTPDGQIFSERALSKIRNHETGHAYAIDELVRRGATPPSGDERAWLAQLMSSGFFTKRRHPGNFVYVFNLTKAAKLAGRGLPCLEYPKLSRTSVGPNVSALPLFDIT